jgi:group I intron endonuclease
MIIYQTINLINGKKYIGKDSHNNPNYLGSGTLLLEDIKKYNKKNFKKEILEYCNSDEELTLKEIYWIRYFNAVNSDDYYNLVEISGGWNFSKISEEKYNYIKEKISKNTKGIKKPELSSNNERKEKLRQANKGKSKPAGFGDKISKLKIGKSLSKEHCSKISKGKLGKKQPQSFLDKKYKSIIQLDKENNQLNEFKSIEEAADSNEIFKRSNISCCLTNKSKTAYGYKWFYKLTNKI